jgi:TatD DNase family protein
VAAIPLNQLLTESDGPFVKMKQRQVRPSDIAEVVVGLAEIYGVEPGTITESIYANFRRILTRDQLIDERDLASKKR